MTPTHIVRTANDLRFRAGVSAWITRHADRTPTTPAIIMDDAQLSYSGFEKRVWQIARVLRENGITRGARVAVLHKNHLEFLPTTMAILRLGAIFVPLNLRLSNAEMATLMADSTPKVLISSSDYRDQVTHLLSQDPSLIVLFTDDVSPSGTNAIAEWPATDADGTPFPIETFDEDTPAGLFYTSGTTGLPKGAIITHNNIRSVATSLTVDVGFNRHDRPMISLPLSVSGTMLAGVMPFLHLGCTLRILEQAAPESISEVIRTYRPTYMASVPTVYKSLLDHPSFSNLDLSCFTKVLSAAAPMPIALIERFQQRGLEVFVQGYGLTESCGFSTCLLPEDAIRKAGSIGKPLLYSDVRIFNEDKEAEAGTIGEIRVSGPSIMAGYWNRPDESAIVDGWLCTGDLGYADEEGYLYVTGRMKDMIVTGGYNVYPAEVENVIHKLDAVAEASVIGVPDERWGERVIALVRAQSGRDLTEESIERVCADALADYKRPKEIRLVKDEFPVNATGKIIKKRLQDAYVSGTLT